MKVARGATPVGANNPGEAAVWVRGMFGRVAHRYDLLNHVLSLHIDKYWRAAAVRKVRHILERPDARVLDLCCGTGDMTLALDRAANRLVYGSDFCHPMLTGALEKSARRRARAAFFEADALQLPLASGSFDLITTAFGFRNLADYSAGLVEMRRLLKPGGTAAILEFTRPPNRLVRTVYEAYSERILPVIGGWISGQRDAYKYLPDSVRNFPAAPQLAADMQCAGFRDVDFEYLTAGTVALHWGQVD
jgi:demethylmenaquinone methyltransferase / 2-methoxy-6-polyprenyl-1,4-benzoquinol methylase